MQVGPCETFMKSPMETPCASVSEVLSWNFEVRDFKFERVQADCVRHAVFMDFIGHCTCLGICTWQVNGKLILSHF